MHPKCGRLLVRRVALREGWSPTEESSQPQPAGSRTGCPQSHSCEEWNLCPLLSCLRPAPLKALICLTRSEVSPWPCPQTLLFGWWLCWTKGPLHWRVSPLTACSHPGLGIGFEELLLQHLLWNCSRATDTLAKAKPTPQEQQFSKNSKQNPYSSFKPAFKV